MAETLSNLSVIAYVVAAVCLVLAVFLWFIFKIPTVIGDLSGRTARKSIAKMRSANEKSGNKAYRASDVNRNRGKLTETMKNPAAFAQSAPQINQVPAQPMQQPPVRPVQPIPQHPPVQPDYQPRPQAAPMGRPETGVLAENRPTPISSEETGILMNENGTAPLAQRPQQQVAHTRWTTCVRFLGR